MDIYANCAHKMYEISVKPKPTLRDLNSMIKLPNFIKARTFVYLSTSKKSTLVKLPMTLKNWSAMNGAFFRMIHAVCTNNFAKAARLQA